MSLINLIVLNQLVTKSLITFLDQNDSDDDTDNDEYWDDDECDGPWCETGLVVSVRDTVISHFWDYRELVEIQTYSVLVVVEYLIVVVKEWLTKNNKVLGSIVWSDNHISALWLFASFINVLL